MSTPMATIKICSGVRLDNRYEHTIYFDNRSKQEAYFAGKVVKTFSAYSYLRKSWDIQVQATMWEARTWNYLYFRHGSEKTYYYFINNVEYVNDSTVKLFLELDVLQTYLIGDDVLLLDCFVERQHTPTDEPGDHTVDEGLDVGELIDNEIVEFGKLDELAILVLSSVNPNPNSGYLSSLGGLYDNMYSGLKVYAVDKSNWAKFSKALEDLNEAEGGKIDGIMAIWMYPKKFLSLKTGESWDTETPVCKEVSDVQMLSMEIDNTPESLDGYTEIKNKKLLCYPYNFLYMSNNSGGSATYRYERFMLPSDESKPKFIAEGCLAPNGSVKVYPNYYNGGKTPEGKEHAHFTNNEYGLTLSSYPSCVWESDVYKIWLAQNQNQNNLAMFTAGATIVGGAGAAALSLMSGNVLGAVGGGGAIISGSQQIAAHLAQKKDMSAQPPQARGNFSVHLNVATGSQTFTFFRKSVNAEHAKVIDDYFTMYGYKINSVQRPQINVRKAFTYVKTVGCKIKGTMCTEDIVKIENIFDKGITFWKDGDRIADYSQDNTL